MKRNFRERFLLFVFGCFLLRFLFSLLIKHNVFSEPILFGFAILSVLLALVWIILFFTNIREYGMETFGDKIWWNSLRPVHAFFWLLFAILIFLQQYSISWIPLCIDSILGLSAFLFFHFLM
jgi:hypothetical protein